MGVALQKVMPADFVVGYGDGLHVSGTLTTMQEAEALREAIRHLGQHLPSHRLMIAGDIGMEPPKPDWRDELFKLFGDPNALATQAPQ
jgi:hypothetical protein